MIYLVSAAEITSPMTPALKRVCVEDVKDRAMTKPMKLMMAALRIRIRGFRQTLPGFVTVSVK